MNPKSIIIGSGIAGIAAAIRLAAKNHHVEVFETNDYPGGKLTQFTQGAFRFDAGPSLFTMPQYVDALFEHAGRNPRDYFNYKRKNESCRYFWNDGARLTAHADRNKFAEEVEKTLGVNAKTVLKKLNKSRQMYELAGRTFLEKPLNRLGTWLTRDVGRSMLRLHKLSLFSSDYRQEFRDIFKGVVPAADPTVYVNITSKDVPTDAPAGCENWFVMVNVPQHTGQNWEELTGKYRWVIISKLNPLLGVELSDLIENESTLTPKDIEVKTSSLGGSLYGTSSNNRYAAFLRHTNDSSRIKGLYFCGGSVHPGGGIPLCLLSAKIVSEICQKP